MGGADYNLCPKCKAGHLQLTASYKNCNGQLVNVKDLAQRKMDSKTKPIQRRQAAIIVQAAPASVVQAAPASVVQAAPASVVQAAPASVVQAAPAPPPNMQKRK